MIYILERDVGGFSLDHKRALRFEHQTMSMEWNVVVTSSGEDMMRTAWVSPRWEGSKIDRDRVELTLTGQRS